MRSPFDFDRQDGRHMECEYFNSFQHFEPEVQGGVVEHVDRPDFQVTLGKRVIGVEVTRLFKRNGAQAIESTQDRILETVCHKAQQHGLPPAQVTLFFSLPSSLDGARRECIAESVVRVIAKHMPDEGGSITLEMQPGQPNEVDLITVNRVHCRARWQWLEMHAIERNVNGLVQEAITRKSKRIKDYLERCDECWLLLVMDSFRSSGNLAFDDTSHIFTSPFTRTYVLNFGRGRQHRLKTKGQ